MITRTELEALDRNDPLAHFHERFALPPDLLYLVGNSLGAMPKATAERMRRVVDQEWSQDLVRSWNQHNWVDLPQRIGDKIGRLIGAAPGETVACDSTSVNLFKALAMAVKLRPGRSLIVSDADNFPTDLYMAQGLSDWLADGLELRTVRLAELDSALSEEVAVVSLSHVNYRTGELFDMAAITRKVHGCGALMLWDLAHSAGALPIELSACGADFAVGCGYKYFNGGPGAPAWIYVAERLQSAIRSPLTGWFGHERPFAFESTYAPATGIGRMLVGTPPILSMSALETSIDLMLEAPMEQIRDKSLRLSSLFIELVERQCSGHGLELLTPREPERRGSQVCLRHPQAWPIMQALIARGVVGDVRAPDILRFGFTPLYLRHTDVWDAASALAEVLRSGEWQRPEFQLKAKVT